LGYFGCFRVISGAVENVKMSERLVYSECIGACNEKNVRLLYPSLH